MTTNLAVQINRLVHSKFGGIQSRLAEALGVTPQAVQHWCAGRSSPVGENLKVVLKLLAEPTSDLIEIPCLDMVTSMGAGRERREEECLVRTVSVSLVWLHMNAPGVDPAMLAVLTARGDSMEGTFSSGDLLLIDTGATSVDMDAIYVYTMRNQLYVRRFQRELDGSLVIRSDNPRYQPLRVIDDSDSFQVVGRLVLALNARRL